MTIFWKDEIPEQFYAVIFTNIKAENKIGYAEADKATMDEVMKMDGFIGYHSSYSNNEGIFISYWKDMESIENWKNNQLHRSAKHKASEWYTYIHTLICKVEKSSIFGKNK